MENKIRIESWCGYEIRFIYVNEEWYAILKDVCDALELRTDNVAQRLEPSMLKRVQVSDHVTTGVRSRGKNKTRWMLAVNEIGIYETLFASRKLEARKFRMWTAGVLAKLRNQVGLKQYEVMRMTEPEVQEEIDHILDTLYYDEETGKLMKSITVQGGDVEQVPFFEEE